MLTTIVLTVIGADRPGLVQLVAARVADHGGNWLESRMCHLGGQFAGIVRVEVPSEHAAALQKSLQNLEAQGLRVQFDGAASPTSFAPGSSATLELVGNDRPGIVRTISGVLAAHGVNVEEFSSECVSAQMGGGMLFQAKVRIFLPEGKKLETVRADLEKIAADLMVDLKLEPAVR